uniref:Cnidarian restricted protein n=1 Tax=Clytia hemisphaerica TaxID=252671 RepID=A0A7M5VFL2_9CNID
MEVMIIIMIIISVEALQILQRLQDDRLWNIILHCQSGCSPPFNWLPIYRFTFSFQSYAMPVKAKNIILKNLLDVIKEPDFNRYEYMHQYLLSRDDLFNETCMKDITMINIYITEGIHDVYFPFFVGLLKKVNALREIKKKQPLRISFRTFTTFFDFITNARKKTMNGMFGPGLMMDVWKPIDSDAVSLHIKIEEWERNDYECNILSEPNVKHYRYASLRSSDCLNAVKMKTFESMDDLIEMMNKDICKRRKFN